MNPSLYQLNPRTYLSSLRRNATLDDIPDSLLSWLAAKGFDWLWLLGVWTIGPTSQSVSQRNPVWRREFAETLPDMRDVDICGSPFALQSYTVDARLGGDAALARLRARLSQHGMKLLLDFVPNHVGFDHDWVRERPDFLMAGTEELLAASPLVWTQFESGQIFAHGRDPNFPGWCDTLQLNYFNPELRDMMVNEIAGIASRCDGVRCDMAMLLEPEVFTRTWGMAPGSTGQDFAPFWPDAIKTVRSLNPSFVFMAEVYWGYEYKLQEHGFDYTYDKTLYDRVLHRDAAHLRGHLIAPPSYQQRMVRFLENHDEQRIATKLSVAEHRAAAAVSYLAPGVRFFHDGQLSGKRIRIPVHLSRAPQERPAIEIIEVYDTLLPIIQSPIAKHGTWNLLETRPAWAGNRTNENFICYLLEHPLGALLVTVNYASYRGQCFVRVPDRVWLEGTIEFHDQLSHERLVRNASDIRDRGLFLDCSEWQTHVFKIEYA